MGWPAPELQETAISCTLAREKVGAVPAARNMERETSLAEAHDVGQWGRAVQILRGVVTWWRFVAAAIVLLTGYTVSHYATAASVVMPTPMTTVVEVTPLVVVVTATPSQVVADKEVVPPSPTATTPAPRRQPTKTRQPAPPSPTATPVPLAADQLSVVARVALQPPAGGWDATGDHLAWLPDGKTLLAADEAGLHRLTAPDFAPAPLGSESLPGHASDLRLGGEDQPIALTAAGGVWTARADDGRFKAFARGGTEGSLRLLRWLPDGRLTATVSCGSDCEQLLALDASGAQPLLDFGARVSPTIPLGTNYLFSPSARLLTFQASGEPHAVIADPQGDWWYLGGWRERERLRAYDQPVAWLDETMLLSYRRSPSGPSVNGHGLDLWRWDVLANTGRFLVADVAAAVPSPDGQRVALVLLGGPAVDEGGHLIGGLWRPDEPVPAVLAVMHVARGILLQQAVLARHPGASESSALDGWEALRPPLWSPDGSALLAFDGDGRPLLFDIGLPDAPPLPLLRQGRPQELAWSPDGSYLALRIDDEVWVLGLSPPA